MVAQVGGRCDHGRSGADRHGCRWSIAHQITGGRKPMTSQQGPPDRGDVPGPAELEGMEVRDASGAPAGRVEDVYVDREVSVTRYVALAGEDPNDYRLVPVEVVRI